MDATNLWDGWEQQFNEAVEVIRCPATMRDVNEELPKASMIYFGGGADIHPSLYWHKNVASAVGHFPSLRDVFEKQIFEMAVEQNIPIFGICRGAQLLCALSGGSLIQDVTGHAGKEHLLLSAEPAFPELWEIPSTHHQMMYIADLKKTAARLIAYTRPLGKVYTRDKERIPVYGQNVDPEIVFFPETRALAVQGHPEYLRSDTPASIGVRSMIKHYLNP